MTTNLKDINFGMNQFCGPSVMSALTGKSTDECAAVISVVSGRQEIRAVSTAHLIEAFRRLRFDMKEIDKNGYSLYANLSSLSAKPGMYIIMVPKHVVAVEVTQDKHLFLIDNHSKQPVPAEASARLSQKCEAVYKITERPQPKFSHTTIRITNGYNTIKIGAVDHYENSDDVYRSLGSFYYKDDIELVRIMTALQGEMK